MGGAGRTFPLQPRGDHFGLPHDPQDVETDHFLDVVRAPPASQHFGHQRRIGRHVLQAHRGILDAVQVAADPHVIHAGHVPDVLECLEPLEDVVGRPEERLLCDAVWESMPRASLSRDMLAHVDRLGVVAMPEAMSGERARPAARALAS